MGLAGLLPDTGQTKCYGNEGEIPCPQPEEPFYGQDAQYNCNPQSYTKLDENGNDLPDNATEWVIARDNVTGLIWEVKQDWDDTPNYTNPHDADNTYTWYDGSSGTPGDGTNTLYFIAALNSSQFGGHSDWRLPTVKELSFLLDRGRYFPTINTTYFSTVSSVYWSSTTRAYYPPVYAWYVDFYDGYVGSYTKSLNYYVRAVRSGQCGQFDNFIDNGDGTVTNTDTGLMWQQDTAPDTYNWQDALDYCETLTLASHNDWRLPNVNELHSIVDYSTYDPSINTDYFPNTESSGYWSSTTYVSQPELAWCVHFQHDNIYSFVNSSTHKLQYDYVRAVRGGQCGSLTTSITTITTTTIPNPCPTELIYGEYSDETELLRYLRDNVLSTTPEGQELIKLYYEWSPLIVRAMEEDEQFREEVKEMIDGVLRVISSR